MSTATMSLPGRWTTRTERIRLREEQVALAGGLPRQRRQQAEEVGFVLFVDVFFEIDDDDGQEEVVMVTVTGCNGDSLALK